MKLSFITIYVRNMDKAIKFYEKVLGLSVERRFQPSDGVDITFLVCEGMEVELIHDEAVEVQNYSEHMSIGFTIEEMEPFLKHLEACKVVIAKGPFPIGEHGAMVFFKDVDGAMIEVVANKS